MVLDHFKPNEFYDYLKSKGCVIISDDDYLEQNVIICDKDGFKMPLQIKSVYYPGLICKVCEMLDIEAPARFLHIKKQFEELKKIEQRRNKKP